MTHQRHSLDCPVCRANAGIERISPGAVIHEGTAWQVEHAYPCSLLGWLVIVLRRHAEALHELQPEEAIELGVLQRAVAVSLHAKLDSTKEYAMCYGEAPRFSHLHVHLVPRALDLEETLRGGGIFAHLRSAEDAVDPETVSKFCDEIGVILRRNLQRPPDGDGA